MKINQYETYWVLILVQLSGISIFIKWYAHLLSYQLGLRFH